MNLDILNPKPFILRITLHIIFWLMVLGFFTFTYGRMNGDYLLTLLHLIITFPIYIASTYITLYYIIPNFVLTKKYGRLITACIYLFLGIAFFYTLITIILLMFPVESSSNQPFDASSLDVYLRITGILIVVFFASLIKLMKYWYQVQRTNELLTKEKFEAEINFFNSQINPHFLFNTLNNLYALTLKNSPKSPEIVLKLSEILDYMLYQSNTDFVSLDKEINIITNYLNLEMLRYDERLKVSFSVTGKTSNKRIPPLLLFPLIENCFKHGVRNNVDESWIDIQIYSHENKIIINISNSIPEVKKETSENSGIGLNNFKKRLLLIYGDKFELKENKTRKSYTLNLIINHEN